MDLVLNGLSHSWPDDIDMLLVSPQGKDALVMSDAGGVNLDQSVVDLTLDDQAATVLPDTADLSTGSYQPADYEPGDPLPGPGACAEWNRRARDVQRYEPERHVEPLRRRRHLR